MRRVPPRIFIASSFLVVCFFLCHCGVRKPAGTISGANEKTRKATQILQTIMNTNAQVATIKGIGFVKIKQDNQVNTFRAAWIGSKPRKFRLEILATTGQPVLSFASDGKRHYLLSYSENRLYKRKASENSLKRLVSISIAPEDIMDLLSGRLPLHPERMRTIEYPGDNGAPVLILSGSERGDDENIVPGKIAGDVFSGIERYNRRGELKFRAVFEKMRDVEGVRIPEKLIITGKNGAMIQITVERCWVNQALPDDRFVLKPMN